MKLNTSKWNLVLLAISFSIIVAGCAPIFPENPISKHPIPKTIVNNGNADTVKQTAQLKPYSLFFHDTLLKKLIDSAVQNNLELAIASQKIKSASSDVIFTRGLLRPRVDANVGSAIRRYGLYTMDGAGNSSTYMLPGKIVPTNLPDYFVGFQSSWELDIWGKLNDRKKSAVSKFLASEEGRNFLISQVVKRTAQSYYELQACDLELKSIEEALLIQNRAYEIVKAKKDAAKLNELAVKQFEAQLLELKSLKEEVKIKIIETEKEINDLLGQSYQPIKRDTGFYLNHQSEVKFSNNTVDLLRNRPDIRKAELEYFGAQKDMSAARKAFYPSLLVTSSLGFQGFRPDLLFLTPQSLAYTLFGNSLMPLVNRSALKAQFNISASNFSESALNYTKSMIYAINEVNAEWQKMESYSSMYQLKQDETERMLESVSIAEELFKNGRASYLEVLYAQQNTLKSKVGMVMARKFQLYTQVNLYIAHGGGWN